METPLNKEQEQLLKLQEKGAFSALSTEEQVFVEKYSSQEAFDQVHSVLMESKTLYSIPEPKPLVLPVATPSRLRLVLVPLSSAAAAAIITFLLFRKETIVFQTLEKPVYLTADTIYLKEKQIDTVIAYRTVQERAVPVQTQSNPSVELFGNRPSDEDLPPITNVNLKNRGVSMKNDNLVGLMEGVSF
ncbi:MAG: hypothetical protein V4638_05650 [Bacteroidota bacterium]